VLAAGLRMFFGMAKLNRLCQSKILFIFQEDYSGKESFAPRLFLSFALFSTEVFEAIAFYNNNIFKIIMINGPAMSF
jgi:hypothetical protein